MLMMKVRAKLLGTGAESVTLTVKGYVPVFVVEPVIAPVALFN
jgi:hypothetical protein